MGNALRLRADIIDSRAEAINVGAVEELVVDFKPNLYRNVLKSRRVSWYHQGSESHFSSNEISRSLVLPYL